MAEGAFDSEITGGTSGTPELAVKWFRRAWRYVDGKTRGARVEIKEAATAHPELGVYSIDLIVTNKGPEALFEAEVLEAYGLIGGQLPTPWYIHWHFNETGDRFRKIRRGHPARLSLMATHGAGAGDPVPRTFDFSTQRGIYTTWLQGLPRDGKETLPNDRFTNRVAMLRIAITNLRVNRSVERWLFFRVRDDLALEYVLAEFTAPRTEEESKPVPAFRAIGHPDRLAPSALPQGEQ